MASVLRFRARVLLLALVCAGCNAILGNELPALRDAAPGKSDAGSSMALPDASGLTLPAANGCRASGCEPFGTCVGQDAAAHCECKPGYALQNGSCADQDECASDNGGCDANAVCINLPGSRACDCKAGYHHAGDTDACVSLCDEAGCDMHASCSVVGDQASCACLAPYVGEGHSCAFDASCDQQHCDAHARCVGTVGSGPHPCVCSEGYEGDGLTCTRVDACLEQPCQHGGRCSNMAGDVDCDCGGTGYRGERCEEPIDDCAQSPCLHGVCSDRVNGYQCDCAAGYGGASCDVDIDDCASKPCQHGTCMDLVHDYKCMCERGYSGKNCDNDVDNCAGGPCARGACVDQVAGYICQCPPGYDGVHCENNQNDCVPKPCVHGTCTDEVASYSCSCDAGYTGATCAEDIDECAAKPCLHSGTCQDKVNAYACTCTRGWAGARCQTGSCANVKCPSAAPCRVPTGQAGLCYPADCGSMAGLCLAENADGSGNASTELLTNANSTWNFGTSNNWNGRSRYFAYLKAVHSWKHICVYPQTNYGGTPIVIPLGQAKSMSAKYGQSNQGPGKNNCPQ